MTKSEVWIDGHDKLAQNYTGRGPNVVSRAAITEWRADRVEIAVDAKSSTILTLHDLWYPGWEVEIDGVQRPMLRADVLFRGVEVPAGSHKVVFAFRPLSWKNLNSAFATALGAPVR
jgi:uncharacterized membrane protein YfhO